MQQGRSGCSRRAQSTKERNERAGYATATDGRRVSRRLRHALVVAVGLEGGIDEQLLPSVRRCAGNPACASARAGAAAIRQDAACVAAVRCSALLTVVPCSENRLQRRSDGIHPHACAALRQQQDAPRAAAGVALRAHIW